MRKEILIITVAAFALNSCGIYTNYKPATEVPEDLYGEEAAVTDSTDNLANLGWRDVFTDPHLRQLIEQGLQQNTDLRSARLRVEEAEATLMSSRLAFLPSFALAPQGTVSSFDGGKATQTYSVPVTASWELDIFGRMRNAKRQAKALLEQLGLGKRLDHLPAQLSGGEQQRVALARAFNGRPDVLFADEPTGNLDRQTGDKIADLLFSLNREHGTTLIMVTHDLQLAKRMNRQLEMRDGHLDAELTLMGAR